MLDINWDSYHLMPLDSHALIRLSGPDRFDFLQGLVSNDVQLCAKEQVIWAALLSPQGKYRHDMLLFDSHMADSRGKQLELSLICSKKQMMALGSLLRGFVLREELRIDIPAGVTLWAIWHKVDADFPATGQGQPGTVSLLQAMADDAIAFADPRGPGLGGYIIAGAATTALLQQQWQRQPDQAQLLAHYQALRFAQGLIDGDQDLVYDKTMLLEAGFDALGAISWQKGCYMGQELTARTRYRGLVKKIYLAFRVAADRPPAIGATIWAMQGDNKLEVGQITSVDPSGQWVMGLVRRAPLYQVFDPQTSGGPWHWSADSCSLAPHIAAWQRKTDPKLAQH